MSVSQKAFAFVFEHRKMMFLVLLLLGTSVSGKA